MTTGILRLSDVSTSRRRFMRGAGTATLSGVAIAMLAGCESMTASNKPMMPTTPNTKTSASIPKRATCATPT